MMENTGSPRSPLGLFGSLRSLLATGVSLLRVRLELLSADVHEAKLRFLRLLVFAAIGVFLLCLGIVVAVFLVAVVFWDTHRVVALSVLSVALAACGIGFIVAARREAARHRFLASTIAELERDRRGLGDG